MDSMAAFLMGEANRNKELMVFDWDEAARIIKACGAKNASAGLRGDWSGTGGDILCDGKIADDYTYLASTWAVPEIEIDGKFIACYRMQSATPGWDAKTSWPQSARDILFGGEF